MISARLFFILGLALLCAIPSHARDQAVNERAAESSISQSDIDGAAAIKTYKPDEFAKLLRQQRSCEKGTLLSSYSAKSGFALDGVNYSLDSFAKEIIRRHGEEDFHCLEIAADCRSTMLVARLTMAIKSIDIRQINLRADEKVFSNKNAKLPECPR